MSLAKSHPGQLLGGSGAAHEQGRAGTLGSGNHQHHLCHLLGGSGAAREHGRACALRSGNHQDLLCHSLGGSGAVREQVRASTLSSGNYPIKNTKGTCAVDAEILHFKVGLRMVAAVLDLNKLEPRRAMVVYTLAIGLLEHRIYMLIRMDVSVEIFGMVAEEICAVEWTPSRPMGKRGITSFTAIPRRASCWTHGSSSTASSTGTPRAT